MRVPRWLRRENLKPLLLFILVPVTGSWFADECRDLIYYRNGWKDPGQAWPWTTTAVALALLVAASAIGVWASRELFRPRNRIGFKPEPDPHPHLVLFLSNLTIPDGRHDAGVPSGLTLTGDLNADLNTIAAKKVLPEKERIRWLWEIPLCGLARHREVLESVTLVCSADSVKQAHWFAALLARYAGHFPRLKPGQPYLLAPTRAGIDLIPCPSTEPAPGSPATAAHWDFEEFDKLRSGLERLLDQFKAEGRAEEDVVFDVTSGQKPNSIVAAIVTVDRGAKFQYVRTNDTSQLLAYDLVT